MTYLRGKPHPLSFTSGANLTVQPSIGHSKRSGALSFIASKLMLFFCHICFLFCWYSSTLKFFIK